MRLPVRVRLRQQDTHRLIPSKYAEDDEDGALARIAEDEAHRRDIADLDRATDDRPRAEGGLLPGIGPEELVFGVPFARIINAAFTYAHPLGSRFNGPERGAWYGAFDLATAQAEVAFHKTVELAEVDWFEESVTYAGYLADFAGEFHDIRGDEAFAPCLDPDSYEASQALAERLLAEGALGVVYPSVRHPAGTCLACFRPALVGNVRRGGIYRFTWSGTPTPETAEIDADVA